MAPRNNRVQSVDAVETALQLARDGGDESWAHLARETPDRIKRWGELAEMGRQSPAAKGPEKSRKRN
jgi:hypothetical protein